jgi:predicted DNA-binding transcriptional regulator AlpA
MAETIAETFDDALLSITQVKRISSLSRSTIERHVKRGRFPSPIQVTPGGRIAWRRSEVLAWAKAPLDWGDPIEF